MIMGFYRGKRKDTGKWVSGTIVSRSQQDTEVYIVQHAGQADEEWCPVIPITVGWYTLTNDKNKTAIFTDDLVKDTCTGAEGIVKFGRYRNPMDTDYTEHIGFFIHWDNLKLKRDIGFWGNNGSLIVTGNIHEAEDKSKEFGGLRDVSCGVF